MVILYNNSSIITSKGGKKRMFDFLDAAAAPTGGTNTWVTLAMLGVMLVVFYFFLYRPQKKQEKTMNEMRNNLQVGDEITTTGGIIGKIISMKDETVMIETGNERTKIRILRSAVRNVDVKAEDAE
jgi:preprotein translocase subunit YajC